VVAMANRERLLHWRENFDLTIIKEKKGNKD
jgi:hypothetical protein